MGQLHVVQEDLVGTRLLDGVQLFPLDVLDQGDLKQTVVRDLPDDGRDSLDPRDLGGAPAALTRDEPVSVRPLPHDDGLDDAVLADGSTSPSRPLKSTRGW